MGKTKLQLKLKRQKAQAKGVLARKRGQTSYNTSFMGVSSFSVADPPKVSRKRQGKKKESVVMATVTTVDVATQTDANTFSSASTQTDPLANSSVQGFYSESLTAARSEIVRLQEQLSFFETWLFGDETAISGPFIGLTVFEMNQLALNVRYLLHHNFVQNTPLRKLVLSVLQTNVNPQRLSIALDFNIKTLQRSLRQSPVTVIGKNVSHKKKCWVHPRALADATRILDVLAPVKSGKNLELSLARWNFSTSSTVRWQSKFPQGLLCHTSSSSGKFWTFITTTFTSKTIQIFARFAAKKTKSRSSRKLSRLLRKKLDCLHLASMKG